MDIPKKDYDSLSDEKYDILSERQRYRRGGIDPIYIFAIVAVIVTILLYTHDSQKNAVRTTPRKSPNASEKSKPLKILPDTSTKTIKNDVKLITDSGKSITGPFANSIKEALIKSDAEYIANAGATIYYGAKSDDMKNLGISLVKYAESLKGNGEDAKSPVDTNRNASGKQSEGVPYHIMGNNVSGGGKITKEIRDYYRKEWERVEKRLEKDMQARRYEKLHSINYEGQLRKERLTRINTEENNRIESALDGEIIDIVVIRRYLGRVNKQR